MAFLRPRPLSACQDRSPRVSNHCDSAVPCMYPPAKAAFALLDAMPDSESESSEVLSWKAFQQLGS